MKLSTVRNWRMAVLMMVFVASVIMMTAPTASADLWPANPNRITVYQGVYSSGSGGEFIAYTSPDLRYVLENGYDDSTLHFSGSTKIGFDTFCIEYNEHFTPGNTYYATFSDYVKYDGLSSTVSLPLTKGVAWLYHEFQTQHLATVLDPATGKYLYDYDPADRQESARNLQNAIWYLQETVRPSSSGNPYAANNYIAQYVTSNVADWQSANNGAIPVKVVNMWNSYNSNTQTYSGVAQDLIVCWAVSEPGLLMLLGTGMVGLVFAGRRFRRQA